MSKLENLYEKMTGLDPKRDLQPPLSGRALIKEVHRLRDSDSRNLRRPYMTNVSIYDAGMESDGPFLVVQATFSDGTVLGAYRFTTPPDPNLLMEFAAAIPQDEWFAFNPDQPSASGI